MNTATNKEMKKLMRKMAVSSMLVIVAFFAFASKGGGGDKKKDSFKTDFTPIRSLNSFTLRSTPIYSGSYSFTHEKETNKLSVNTSFTYQRGNTIYILPYKYKVNVNPTYNATPKTNLQFLGVKIKIAK